MNPLLYEVNTRCWLRGLSDRLGTAVTLATVPDSELAGWQKLGFTHIWLMGVWTTGPRARAEALKMPELRRAYDQVLPGWQEADVAGSPYAIAGYKVPPALGGEAGLADFRRRLRERGMKLLLDFVPNHVGLDHPWIVERPELVRAEPCQRAGDVRAANPRRRPVAGPRGDPYFAPWTDAVQVDYRRAAARPR